LITIAGRAGRLPQQLAKNLSELDVSYRAGWRVDGAKTVERWSTKGYGAIRDLDPAFRLVVPQVQQEQAAADIARFGGLPVRVVPQADLAQTTLVRPDGYVAGHAAPGQQARLLGLLARVLRA
jgi:hypothetical protein